MKLKENEKRKIELNLNCVIDEMLEMNELWFEFEILALLALTECNCINCLMFVFDENKEREWNEAH